MPLELQNTIFNSYKKYKLLWENLTKDATLLYLENYETLLEIIKEELSQWNVVPCLGVRTLCVVEIRFPQIDLHIQCNSGKIPGSFLEELTNWLCRILRTDKSTLIRAKIGD